MTWTKLGSEYSNNLFNDGLSDAAYRTHSEAIQWVYDNELTDCRFAKNCLQRFAGSERRGDAAEELIRAEYWRDDGSHYVLLHHAEVIRQSLAAQQAKRDGDRARQQRHRTKKTTITPGVTRDITDDDAETQTDKQPTSRDEGVEVSATCIRCGGPSRRGCSTCWNHAEMEAS
jgi:hypothetical protein